MFLISQIFIYLALALIIGGAIGFALRACLADRACDEVREDLALANARYNGLLESTAAAQTQQVIKPSVAHNVSTGLGDLHPRDLEFALLQVAPGTSLKGRFAADDLTVIKGITPEIDVWLGLNGITRFSQIASLSASELYWLVENLPQDGASVYRDQWVAQAIALDHG